MNETNLSNKSVEIQVFKMPIEINKSYAEIHISILLDTIIGIYLFLPSPLPSSPCVIEKLIISPFMENINVKYIARNVFRPELSENCYYLASDLFPIDELEILSGIQIIGSESFKNTHINTVIWPDSCRFIPNYCFSHSTLKYIKGIEKVEHIAMGAFQYTNIETFDWPQNADCVCCNCFNSSKLKEIHNLTATQIYEYAFSNTKLETFNWPELCSTIPRGCFLGCQNLYNFSGTGIINSIEAEAFKNTIIKFVDFSKSKSMYIVKYVEDETDDQDYQIIMPFYGISITSTIEHL